MKQHFFLWGRYLGSRPIRTYTSIGAETKVASSYLLICPDCAEIWGRLMHECPSAFTQLVSSRCIKHALFPSEATFSIPAAWEGDPRVLADDWPLAALNHDVEAIASYQLAKAEKEEKECQQSLHRPATGLSSADQRYLSSVLPDRERLEVSGR